jgi:hypothetical protein
MMYIGASVSSNLFELVLAPVHQLAGNNANATPPHDIHSKKGVSDMVYRTILLENNKARAAISTPNKQRPLTILTELASREKQQSRTTIVN